MNDSRGQQSFPSGCRQGAGRRDLARAGANVEIRDPYRGEVVGTAPVSSMADLDAALDCRGGRTRQGCQRCPATSAPRYCGAPRR